MPSTPKKAQPSNRDGNGVLTLSTGSGSVWSVAIPHLTQCATADIVITSTLPSAVNGHVDPDESEVQVLAHVFTRADGSGVACRRDDTGACKRMTRRLPLRYDPGRDAFIARIVPDPSALQYVIEVQVCVPVWLCVCVCVVGIAVMSVCVLVAGAGRELRCEWGVGGGGVPSRHHRHWSE